jgi:metallo-beta-lactamase class B
MLDAPPALPNPEAPITCDMCAEWDQAQAPFRIYGNTYYVGVAGLSAILVTGPQGHVLIDGDLPQSAPLIRANVEALGFKVSDIKWILNSHAHFDHASGIAAMQQASGAQVAASESGAKALQAGGVGEDDPQFEAAKPMRYAPVAKVRVVQDGEEIVLGPLHVQAIMTPGHTPGSTSWTWTSCEANDCKQVVYSDSLSALALGDFRFSGGNGRADISSSFANSIERIGALKCDIVLSTHPDVTAIFDRLAASTASHNAFVDPQGCKALAEASAKRLQERLLEEAKPGAAPAGDKH